MTLLAPIVILRNLQSLKDSLHTSAVCAVWVSKVASSINLMRTHLAQQLNDDIYISIGKLTLLNTSRLVEWEI